MKRIVYPLIAAMAIAGASTTFAAAKTDCKKDIAQFDLAVKTTKAGKADVASAKKMRIAEAARNCPSAAMTGRHRIDTHDA